MYLEEDLDDIEEIWINACNNGFVTEYEFSSFLTDICREINNSLKEAFPPETRIRTHFRWYCGFVKSSSLKNDYHETLCHDDTEDIDGYEPPPKIINWGGLIKGAFESGYNLVNSSNNKLNSQDTSWHDFMTVIPRFSGHEITLRVKRGTFAKRPFLTFGISIKNENDLLRASNILSFLDYLKIDEHISALVDDYFNFFRFNIDQFRSTRRNKPSKI